MSLNLNKLSVMGKNMHGSEIRRLFATSMRPNVISFAGGMPDPGSFPSKKVAQLVEKLLLDRGEAYLQYGPSRGTTKGISAAIDRMKRRDIAAETDEIIMTSGSQQAIDLMTRTFIDPGDMILVENPTFIGALGTFRNGMAMITGVPIDNYGIIPEELVTILENTKKKGHKVKFLYLLPNFQNPTGQTMALERRKLVLQIAEEYDFLIFEDDPYGELWFTGGLDSVRPIKSLDQNDRVIYTSSFSKIISPGIRLGWLAAPSQLIERFDMGKQMMDVCTNPLMQAVAHELCVEGFLDEHIDRLRHIYSSRAQTMLNALSQYMPEGVSWTKPDGGFFIWVTLPEHVNTLKLLEIALANDVVYVIGSAFYAEANGENTLRISFCHENEQTIEEGIKRLGKAVKEYLVKN